MTRKEAHAYKPSGKCTEDGDGYRLVMPLADHIDTVNAIYDDLESRTCENCKHYITEYTVRDNHCGYDGMFEIAEILKCTKDFGCNKFERKEK